MINADLTQKQKDVLDYIREQIFSKGYPPSVREICAALDFKSTSTVHSHIAALEKKGILRKDPTKPRALEIIEDAKIRKELLHIPIVDMIAVGEPILAAENIIDTFSLPLEYIKSNNQLFMLQIKDSSMIGAGMHDGDYLIVESTTNVNNGDIVVVLLDENTTVKRFYKEEDHIILRPENPSMDDIIVKDCTILGKSIGLFRTMNQ